MAPPRKKTILIDFDGTLNSYRSGWDGNAASLPDPPNPHAISFLRKLLHSEIYEPVIFTTRALNRGPVDFDRGEGEIINQDVVKAIRAWLRIYGLKREEAEQIRVTCIKVPCKLIIDDNALRFEGEWPTDEELKELTK